MESIMNYEKFEREINKRKDDNEFIVGCIPSLYLMK